MKIKTALTSSLVLLGFWIGVISETIGEVPKPDKFTMLDGFLIIIFFITIWLLGFFTAKQNQNDTERL